MTYCLESWSVIGWLEGEEPVRTRVEEIIGERPLISWINVGEVYYQAHRKKGPEAAVELIADLRSKLTFDPASPRRIMEAAAIKADHPIAYADAFAVATAISHRVTLLTGDPEILNVDAGWPVEDVGGVKA